MGKRTRPTRLFQPLILAWTLLALLLSVFGSSVADASEDRFASGLELLKERSFDRKIEAIDLLAASGNEQARSLMELLQAGELYLWKKEKRLVLAEQEGKTYLITDVLSGEALGAVKKRKIKRIGLNNAMRARIQQALALLDLKSPDADKRLAAIEQMFGSMDADTVKQIHILRKQEQNPDVQEAMDIAIALGDIAGEDQRLRMAAVQTLAKSLQPTARNALSKLAQAEADSETGAAARKALKQIDFEIQLYGFAETLFFGLSLGSILVLAAIGLAITFGVMGVINMAHGELIMLGAYTTYIIQQLLPNHIDISLFLAIPAAFVVSGLVGILIERGVIRFLYGRPLETLLATFGVSLILQQLARTLISPQNVPVSNPSWMSGSLEINSILSLTMNRLYIIVFALLVFAALFMILKRTSLGLQVRAVSQNRAMARAMGVRSEWVDALTFGLGSGIAGVAGVALSQLTNVGPNLGQAYIIDSFMVVVFGGVGNLWGTLVGGLSLGVANKFMEPWAGAVLAKILVLLFIILFIQKRPRGLFPQRGRAAEG
jgi:urea transport system permease protein